MVKAHAHESNQPFQEKTPEPKTKPEPKSEQVQVPKESVVKEKTATKEEGNPSGLTAKNDVRDLGEEFNNAFGGKQNASSTEPEKEIKNDPFAFDLDFSMEQ